MSVDIEQHVDDLLKHTGVWEETKETLRELLAEHKAGTLDPDDARYIEGLHKKMFAQGRAGAVMTKAGARHASRDVRPGHAANDDTELADLRGEVTGALIAALREDLTGIVTPADMPESEQSVRREIIAAIHAKLDEYQAKEEG